MQRLTYFLLKKQQKTKKLEYDDEDVRILKAKISFFLIGQKYEIKEVR